MMKTKKIEEGVNFLFSGEVFTPALYEELDGIDKKYSDPYWKEWDESSINGFINDERYQFMDNKLRLRAKKVGWENFILLVRYSFTFSFPEGENNIMIAFIPDCSFYDQFRDMMADSGIEVPVNKSHQEIEKLVWFSHKGDKSIFEFRRILTIPEDIRENIALAFIEANCAL